MNRNVVFTVAETQCSSNKCLSNICSAKNQAVYVNIVIKVVHCFQILC